MSDAIGEELQWAMILPEKRSRTHTHRATATLPAITILTLLTLVQLECRGANAVVNPSLEADNLSAYRQAVWSGNATVTLASTTSHSGRKALQITGTNASATVWQEVPVRSNTVYTLELWLSTSELTGQGKTGLEIKSIPDKVVYYMSSDTQPNDGSWHRIAATVWTGRARKLLIICAFEMYGNGTGTAFFDDLSVRPADDLGGTTGAYVVSTAEGAFCAQDAGTREIHFADADAATLLNGLRSLPQCQAISLLPGDYPLKAPLRLKTGLSLSGRPGSRLLQRCNGALLFGSSVSNCQVTQLELAGSRGSFSGAALRLRDGSRSNTLADLVIHDFQGDGINLTSSNTQFNVIRRNRIENCLSAGIGHFYTAGDAIIEDNYINRTGSHGIIVSYGGSNCRIVSNTVINAGCYIRKGGFAHGIAADGWGKVHGHRNLIAGNVISNSAMAGIEVADFQHDCTIAHNEIIGTGLAHMGCDYGIYFGGGLAPGTNATIVANIVRNTAGPGIRVDSPRAGELGTSSGVTVTGNLVRDCDRHGILIGVGANVTVRDNICQDNGNHGSGSGICIQGRGAPSRSITIIGNQCLDKRNPARQEYGVSVDDAREVMVSGNTLTPNKLGPVHQGRVSGLTLSNNR